jgi:hypothetical protein
MSYKQLLIIKVETLFKQNAQNTCIRGSVDVTLLYQVSDKGLL